MFHLILNAMQGLGFSGSDNNDGNLIYTICTMAALTFFTGMTPYFVSRIKRWAYDILFETAYISDMTWAFYRLDEYMTTRSDSSVYRLEVYDERDAMVKMWKADQTSTWRGDGLCGEQTPVFGDNKRMRFPSGWVWLNRKSADTFARASQNARISHAGKNSHQSLCINEYIQVSTLRWQRQAIKELFAEVHKEVFDRKDGELRIYTAGSDSNRAWGNPSWRASRPWSSAILPKDVKASVLDDITEFLTKKEKKWYQDRGEDMHLTTRYLLSGPPGAGKTTLATALASKLSMDIYIVNPAAPNMDDAKLTECFRKCPSGNMLLIEDIDCVMPQRPTSKTEGVNTKSEKDKDSSKVTLSGLLNAIDGVASQEGSILLASTNHPELLDHALIRPGRFDVKIEFTNATASQARDLFCHFFPLEWINDEIADRGSKTCSCHSNEKAHSHNSDSTKCTQEKLEEMAKRFSEALEPAFEGKGVSMAALQAYMLTKKSSPEQAIDGAAEWAEEQKKKADEADKKALEAEEKAKKEKEEEDQKKKKEEEEKSKKEDKGKDTDAKVGGEKSDLTVATSTTAAEEGFENVDSAEAIPSSPS